MSSNKPFPSSDLDVFKENSLILDNFVNSQENEHPDRFARKRPTITGIIKEAFNVRTDISNMNETLIGQSRWDAVPKNTSLSLGGDNGALNKQAQALFNRTIMLKAHAREALRRTYQEIGLVLVPGSFEDGGKLETIADILLEEKTGKVYSWNGSFPKVVNKGTLPTSEVEFVDKTKETRAANMLLTFKTVNEMLTKLPSTAIPGDFFSTGLTIWEYKTKQKIPTIEDFKAVNDIHISELHNGGSDYSDALQNSINKAFIDQVGVYIGPGRKRITRTIIIPMGPNYQHPGTCIYGNGRGKSILDFDNINRASYAIAGFSQAVFDETHGYSNFTAKGFSLTNSYGSSYDISVMILMKEATGCDWDDIHISKCVTCIQFTGNAWINNFTNLFLAPKEYGFRMDSSGTTNRFDRLFVFGSEKVAYKLRSIYSTIGALAADDCIGVAYDLRWCTGTAGALGTEQPGAGRTLDKLLLIDHSSLTVGALYGFRAVPNAGVSWTCIEVGTGIVDINELTLDAHDQTPGDKTSEGTLISGYAGGVKIRNVNVTKDSNGIATGKLLLGNSNLVNTTLVMDNVFGTSVHIVGDSHPAMGGSKYSREFLSVINSNKKPIQSVVFDNFGGPLSGGSVNDQKYRWQPGYQSGSVFLENDPKKWGVAGYVATNTSNDINGQVVIPVAAIMVEPATTPKTGTFYYDTVLKKPFWWDGSVYRDSAGVAKP